MTQQGGFELRKDSNGKPLICDCKPGKGACKKKRRQPNSECRQCEHPAVKTASQKGGRRGFIKKPKKDLEGAWFGSPTTAVNK